MKKWRLVYPVAAVTAAVIGLGLWRPAKQAVADDKKNAPRFKVDPFWPKPLPNDTETNPAAATDGYRATGPGATKPWVTGEVAGTAVDSRNHVFTVNRGPQNNLVAPEPVTAHPSPSVIEFDTDGNVANAWPPNVPSAAPPWWTAPMDPLGYTCRGPGCPHPTRGVPTGIHGVYVDYQDNVWIAGNGDGIVQKYTHDGSQLLLQLGSHSCCDNPCAPVAGCPVGGGACGNTATCPAANKSLTLLNQPPNVRVDPNPDPVTRQTGSIYVPDGYGNHRVIVFDRNGNHLRHWGGVVRNATMPNLDPHDRGSFGAGDGGHPHCLVIGRDGFLYVCDRQSDRILVFEKAPTSCTVDQNGDNICQPVRIITVIPGTGVTQGKSDNVYKNILGTAGSAWDLVFSLDKQEDFFFEVDGGNEIVWEFDHQLAVSDQGGGTFTTCSTPECGPWPRYILAGFGRPGHQAAEFTFLHSVALDSHGNLFTGETINGRRIQKFVPNGNLDTSKLGNFRPSGYPDVTLKHYDARSSGNGDKGDKEDKDDD